MSDLGAAVELLIADVGGVSDYGLDPRNLLAGTHAKEVAPMESGPFGGPHGRLEKSLVIDVGAEDLCLGGVGICSEQTEPLQRGFEKHGSPEAGIENPIIWRAHRPVDEGGRHRRRRVEGPERLFGFVLRERHSHPSDFMDGGGSLVDLNAGARVLPVHTLLESRRGMSSSPSKSVVEERACNYRRIHEA